MDRRDWRPVICLLAVARALILQRGRDSSNDDTADGETAPDVEMAAAGEIESRVFMGDESLEPIPSTSAGIHSEDQQTPLRLHRNSRGGVIVGQVRRIGRRFLGGITFAVDIHMNEERTEQSEGRGKHLKRLYEYTKNAISFESVILAALCNSQSYHSHNKAFKISFAMLLLSFFTDLVTALLLLISSAFPIKYLIYASSISQMLMPFSLLVSSGQLHPYMILAVPLPFFVVSLLDRAGYGAGVATDAKTLSQIFDVSAGIYALAAGCALTSTIFGPSEPVVANHIAFLLFLTIFIARYLMLISTLRPPEVVHQAQTLMYLLKLLLASTVIFVAVQFLGRRLAFAAISVGIIDAALTSMFLLIHSPRTTVNYRSKDRQLLSAVMVIILFTVLTQIHSEHGTTPHVSLGSTAKLRLVLYFAAFLWSLNRMLIPLAGVAAGGGLAVTVWSALEWARASIVVVAVLDMVYKFGITFIMGKN